MAESEFIALQIRLGQVTQKAWDAFGSHMPGALEGNPKSLDRIESIVVALESAVSALESGKRRASFTIENVITENGHLWHTNGEAVLGFESEDLEIAALRNTLGLTRGRVTITFEEE